MSAKSTTIIGRILCMACLVMTLQSTVASASGIYCFQDSDGKRYYTNVPGPGRTKVRLPLPVAQKTIEKARAMRSSPQQILYEPAIQSASRNFAVDPDIIRAVITAESNYNEQAVSPKGALGLMQLMPMTAREMGVEDAFDPVQNIYGGVRYLSGLLDTLNDDLPLALAAYNAGPSRVLEQKRIPPIPETLSYVERVLNLYRNFKGRNAL